MFDAGCNPQPLMHREMHTPTVATDHQSVKRGTTRAAPEPNGCHPRQQVAMDSVSEDALESSLGGPSLRRLLACPKWDRIGAKRLWTRLGCIPVKPGEKHRPTATPNERLERGNRSAVLRHTGAGVNRI